MKINFTPGPSQLYFTIEDHAKKAFRDGIPSLSHRSKQFENIYASVREGLQALLGLPAQYEVLFTSSATEIWERSIENLVDQRSHHFVNGAFSARYFEIATQLGRKATRSQAPEGNGFDSFDLEGEIEFIALTHNETSTGVSLPLDVIHSFQAKYPASLIAVDAVSSLPYPAFDYSRLDTVFFSVQKAFGLPAGLGVWLVNERCIERANQRLASGKAVGTYHSLPSLVQHARKNQTPETPNVLAIYLLSKVLDDFNRRGIDTIRKETDYKAALLYQALEKNKKMSPSVADSKWRSKTVIVANCEDHIANIQTTLQSKELYPGDGYGKFKTSQLRFANFPTHSKEQYEWLVDTLDTL